MKLVLMLHNYLSDDIHHELGAKIAQTQQNEIHNVEGMDSIKLSLIVLGTADIAPREKGIGTDFGNMNALDILKNASM